MSFTYRPLFATACAALVVSGCSDGGGSTGLPADGGSDTPITVSGAVIDSAGYPYPGLTVFIDGAAPVSTNAAGEFVIDGVTPPYDVLVVSLEEDEASLYVGLTRPDPVLDPPLSVGNEFEADVVGTLVAGAGSGFVSPNPPNTHTRVSLHAPLGSGTRSGSPGVAISPYDFPVFWGREPALAATIHALQWTEIDGVTTAVVAYGSKSVSGLDAGEILDVGAITMNAVGDLTIGGTVEVLGAFEVAEVQTGIRLADGFVVVAGRDASGATSFEQVSPDIAGASGYAAVYARDPARPGSSVIVARGGLGLPASDVVLTVPDIGLPEPVSPAPGTGDIGAGDELVWEGVPDAVYYVTLRPTSSDAALPRIIMFTTTPRVAIPDLAPYGVGFPPATSYTWNVSALVGIGDVDDLAAPGAFSEALAFRREVLVVGTGQSRTVITP